MQIKIKRKQSPEKLYLEFMLLLGLFFGYFEVTAFWNAGIILLSAWLVLASKQFQNAIRKDLKVVLLISVLIVFIIVDILNTTKGTYLSYNLIQIVRPILILVSLYYVSSEKRSISIGFLYSRFFMLNFMWVVNLIVLGLQVAGTGFMIKASWMAVNSFYEDNCTGLFGGSSTHIVMLFTIFITLYNLEIGIEHIHTLWKRKLFIIYIFATLLLMLLFSTQNDNTAIFVFVPIFLVWYYLHKLKVMNVGLFKKIINILKYVILMVILLVVLNFIPGVSDFINTTVIDKINGMINFRDTNQLGSVERLAIVADALNRGVGWRFGKGIGAWHIMGGVDGGYAGFAHFGLSSVGSFVYLIGIWGYLLIVLVYSCLLSKMSSSGVRLSFIGTFVVVNLLCFYTMFLTATHAIMWSIFIFLILNSVGMEKHGQ